MSLLNNIASSEKKIAYQTYTIQHGIEKINIQIPLSTVSIFEKEFKTQSDKSKVAITRLVEKHLGKIKG